LGAAVPAVQSFVQASVGYEARFDLRLHPKKATQHIGGDAIVSSADAAVWLGRSILLSGRFDGSWKPEKNGEPAERATALGPLVTYRVDDRLDAYAGAWFDVSGRNVTAANTYYAGVTLKQTQLNRLQGYLGNSRRP